jgi:hypothetical protein
MHLINHAALSGIALYGEFITEEQSKFRNDIARFPKQDKKCILYALDTMINNVKLKGIQ